jgi:hypothetical protein
MKAEKLPKSGRAQLRLRIMGTGSFFLKKVPVPQTHFERPGTGPFSQAEK